jgi:uncharacterized protein YecA (UPF0149 family)
VVHEDAEVKIKKEQQRMVYNRSEGGDGSKQSTPREQKVGRNEPCPCGSGKKYKKCCANK